MGTSLTGLTPSTTYDALIKVGDNGPLSATAKVLSDGLGNDSPIALSTTLVGIGTATPATVLDVVGSDFMIFANNSAGNRVIKIGTQPGVGEPAIQATLSNGTARQLSLNPSGGNVGIGTTTPANVLSVKGGNGNELLLDNAGERFTQMSFQNNSLQKSAIWLDETNDEFVLFATTGYSVPIYAGNVERVRVTDNGLTFNGDTAAANALDDYEEGTWTMGVSFGGGSTGATYNLNTGSYTKIGRQVTVSGLLTLSSKGSSTGGAKITGLPFTIQNNIANYAAVSLWVENITFANQIFAIGALNSTDIEFYESTEAGVNTALSNVDFANNSQVIVNFTYFV